MHKLRKPTTVVRNAMAMGFATARLARTIHPGAVPSTPATRRYSFVVKMLYSFPKIRISGGATIVIRESG